MWLLSFLFFVETSTHFFSPGKLLITSEYTVLDGALALAVPTKPGQDFFALEEDNAGSLIYWEALHQGKPWLNATIDYDDWKILDTNIQSSAEFILKVLKSVQQLSQIKFTDKKKYRLKTDLQFPADFGLGSSSTLMNNLAEWASIDAYILNEISLGGSGYDIAVAKEKTSLLYTNSEGRRTVEKIEFNPPFLEELVLIHLNRKQDSREGINHYRKKVKSHEIIDEFTDITKQITATEDLEKFSLLMQCHEEKLSQFLEIPTSKEKFFKNCPVFVKSLGAWGGDFVLSRKFDGYQHYFSDKGFDRIFNWKDLVI